MAKYYGEVGYRTTEETETGIWEEVIIPRNYYGDILKNYVRNNDNTYISTIKSPVCNNSISIVADPYAFENFQNIVYATYMNAKWVVTNIDVQYPRLILTLGGAYNEESTDSASNIG